MIEEKPHESRICEVEGCKTKHYAKGLCKKHYCRMKKYGNPMETKYGRDNEKHGYSKTSEYNVWQNMKKRCYSESDNRFDRYGGRGIKVCDSWENSFLNFITDMGPKPFEGAEIDRIDNDGNYEPSNCRWVSRTQNIRNCSMTKIDYQIALDIREEFSTGKYTQKEIGERYGIKQANVHRIIANEIWKVGDCDGFKASSL